MVQKSLKNKTVCVVGLGYVGLPLAEAFAQKITTIGYEIVEEKARHIAETTKAPLHVTSDPAEIKKADFISICVPTPVKKTKEPDLFFVESAARVVGQNLKPGAIVVLESTVYPGVTEEIVRPILEKESGFVCGKDFKVGYSPERINPGDEAHKLAKITKIVAGMDSDTTRTLAECYGLITTVYTVSDIKTAEAAKVIENIQRDLNIALMNELSLIFNKMGINTKAVIDAAATKWNFTKFSPGLVGGHCIPVDPYYLVHKAQELGYHPQVILAGRAINDSMPRHVAYLTIKGLNEVGKVIKGSKVLIMGLTYKENVDDIRESPAHEIIRELKEFGVDLIGYDPLLRKEVVESFDIRSLEDDAPETVDGIIITVPHNEFKKLSLQDLEMKMSKKPVLIDIKGIYSQEMAKKRGFYYSSL